MLPLVTGDIGLGMVRSGSRLAASLLGPAVALAACDHAPGLGPWSRVVLSVTAARSVISVGDSTRIVFSLRNLGPESVSLTTGACSLRSYIAAQPSGQIVYPGGGSWFCATMVGRFTLAPGAERAETLLVRGGAYSVAAYPAVSLDRGRYLAYATFSSVELSLRSESVPLTVQ